MLAKKSFLIWALEDRLCIDVLQWKIFPYLRNWRKILAEYNITDIFERNTILKQNRDPEWIIDLFSKCRLDLQYDLVVWLMNKYGNDIFDKYPCHPSRWKDSKYMFVSMYLNDAIITAIHIWKQSLNSHIDIDIFKGDNIPHIGCVIPPPIDDIFNDFSYDDITESNTISVQTAYILPSQYDVTNHVGVIKTIDNFFNDIFLEQHDVGKYPIRTFKMLCRKKHSFNLLKWYWENYMKDCPNIERMFWCDNVGGYHSHYFEKNTKSTLFGLCCFHGCFEFAKFLWYQTSLKPNIHAQYECAFRGAIVGGNIEIAEWILSLDPKAKLTCNLSLVFIECCVYGTVNALKWLIDLGIKRNRNVDTSRGSQRSLGNTIYVYNGMIFGRSDINIPKEAFALSFCHGKNFDIVRWLWESYDLDIHMDNDKLFKYAWKHNGTNRGKRWSLKISFLVDKSDREISWYNNWLSLYTKRLSSIYYSFSSI